MRYTISILLIAGLGVQFGHCSKTPESRTHDASADSPKTMILDSLAGNSPRTIVGKTIVSDLDDVLQVDTATTDVNLSGLIFNKAQRPTYSLPIAGSESYAFYRHGRHTLSLYSHYAVAVFEMEPNGGDSILVFPFTQRRDSLRQAYIIDHKPIFTSSEFGAWFFGILHGYLFLDLGTGPDRGLAIYRLADSARMIYGGDYSRKIFVVPPDSLSFYEPISREPTEQDCPDMKEWRVGGLGAILEERVVLSLRTLSKRRTGEIRCASTQ